MTLSYATANLGSDAAADPALVRDLQRDLRALGYLAKGIDGRFGSGTLKAVRRLQFDLLNNRGGGSDRPAPVAMILFNRGVTMVTGVVDAALANSIAAALDDARVAKLPESRDPAADNQAAVHRVASLAGGVVPAPFLLAMFQQESSCQHFEVPRPGDSDAFITVGLDTGTGNPDNVTSRGYGIGQYTLYHHPPRAEEVTDLMLDPGRNVQQAVAELREKFDGYVVGPSGKADDRSIEHPIISLRLCRYAPSDPRYMTDCRACAQMVGKVDIGPDTVVYKGSAETYGQAKYYANPHYTGVPDRAQFLCDWPYAARRYNGGSPDSYNYQARILLNLLLGPG